MPIVVTFGEAANKAPDLLSIIGAVIAAAALGLSVWTAIRGIRAERTNLDRVAAAERRNLTVAVWQQWVSSDYRSYRVDAWDALRKGDPDMSARPRMAPILKKAENNNAIGSVEHFIDEVSQLVKSNLVEKPLFDDLFGRSLIAWNGILYRFDREGSDAFSEAELDCAFLVLLGEEHRKLGREDYERRCHPAR